MYLAIQGQEDTDVIQNELNILQAWGKACQVSGPVQIQVSRVNKNKYTMQGQFLEAIDCASYLCVDISSDLNFSHYNNCVTANASKGLGFLKETKSATMNIFDFFYFLFKSFIKVKLSYVFTINLFTIAENCTEK